MPQADKEKALDIVERIRMAFEDCNFYLNATPSKSKKKESNSEYWYRRVKDRI